MKRMNEAQKNTNLDIEKLRADKLKNSDSDLMNLELEELRRKREETKKAIIAKINANYDAKEQVETNKKVSSAKKPTKAKYTSSVKEKAVKEKTVKEVLKAGDKARKNHPEIKILPKKEKSTTKIKDHSERLSYTMQMDVFSKDQIKKHRQARQSFDVQDKFNGLEKTISKMYFGIVLFLSLLIIINILIINVFL